MADDGLIADRGESFERPGVLPSVTVLEIVERDSYGEFIARPATWPEEHGAPPRVLMVESKQDRGAAAGIGDRVLARITALGPDANPPYQARTIKRLPRLTRSQLGIFRALPGGGGVIDPVDRKQLKEWRVARGATQRRREWRTRPLRAWRTGSLRRRQRPRHRPARQSAGSARDEPHRHPCPWHSRHLPGCRAERG